MGAIRVPTRLSLNTAEKAGQIRQGGFFAMRTR